MVTALKAVYLLSAKEVANCVCPDLLELLRHLKVPGALRLQKSLAVKYDSPHIFNQLLAAMADVSLEELMRKFTKYAQCKSFRHDCNKLKCVSCLFSGPQEKTTWATPKVTLCGNWGGRVDGPDAGEAPCHGSPLHWACYRWIDVHCWLHGLCFTTNKKMLLNITLIFFCVKYGISNIFGWK